MIRFLAHLGDAFEKQARYRRVVSDLEALPKAQLERRQMTRNDIPRRAARIVYGI